MAKGLLGEIPPQILAGLFYLGSGIGLTILTWLLRGRTISHEAPLAHADVPWFLGAVIFGGILAPVLLLTGLQQTPASNASLLLNLETVFTVMLAWVVFHESADRKFALGMGAILLGSVFLSWNGVALGGGLLGPLAIAAACLCWGVDNNLTQKVSAHDPVQISAIKGLVAGTVNLLLGIWFLSALPALVWVSAALVVGFFSYGLSIVLFVLALRNLGTARTGGLLLDSSVHRSNLVGIGSGGDRYVFSCCGFIRYDRGCLVAVDRKTCPSSYSRASCPRPPAHA